MAFFFEPNSFTAESKREKEYSFYWSKMSLNQIGLCTSLSLYDMPEVRTCVRNVYVEKYRVVFFERLRLF